MESPSTSELLAKWKTRVFDTVGPHLGPYVFRGLDSHLSKLSTSDRDKLSSPLDSSGTFLHHLQLVLSTLDRQILELGMFHELARSADLFTGSLSECDEWSLAYHCLGRVTLRRALSSMDDNELLPLIGRSLSDDMLDPLLEHYNEALDSLDDGDLYEDDEPLQPSVPSEYGDEECEAIVDEPDMWGVHLCDADDIQRERLDWAKDEDIEKLNDWRSYSINWWGSNLGLGDTYLDLFLDEGLINMSSEEWTSPAWSLQDATSHMITSWAANEQADRINYLDASIKKIISAIRQLDDHERKVALLLCLLTKGEVDIERDLPLGDYLPGDALATYADIKNHDGEEAAHAFLRACIRRAMNGEVNKDKKSSE